MFSAVLHSLRQTQTLGPILTVSLLHFLEWVSILLWAEHAFLAKRDKTVNVVKPCRSDKTGLVSGRALTVSGMAKLTVSKAGFNRVLRF